METMVSNIKSQTDPIYSSRTRGCLAHIVNTLEELESLKSKWISDIDNNPKSTIFHTWEWILNCIITSKSGPNANNTWKIYLGYDKNSNINFMVPTYPYEDQLSYLGMLYSDYTDPFCTKDDYFEVMRDLNIPSIILKKTHRISNNVSTICLYSYDCSDIKSKFLKDLRRQKRKLDNYSVFIDKGNKHRLWGLFHDLWCKKWGNKWSDQDQNLFKDFVINNKALNAGVLFIDNKPVAINLHTIHNGLCMFWVISRNPSIKISSGNFLWYELMKVYEQDPEVYTMNGGMGLEKYKYNFFNKEEKLYGTYWTNS